ncbi:hypothetical protein MnTg02_00628 [bacterium MnTg02]|nr:hypothetical protein MnTg02_00628 [bacterium MnTg02]
MTIEERDLKRSNGPIPMKVVYPIRKQESSFLMVRLGKAASQTGR